MVQYGYGCNLKKLWSIPTVIISVWKLHIDKLYVGMFIECAILILEISQLKFSNCKKFTIYNRNDEEASIWLHRHVLWLFISLLVVSCDFPIYAGGNVVFNSGMEPCTPVLVQGGPKKNAPLYAFICRLILPKWCIFLVHPVVALYWLQNMLPLLPALPPVQPTRLTNIVF